MNWAKIIGTYSFSNRCDIAIDTLNNIFAAYGSSVEKIDQNGNELWTTTYTRAHGIEVDAAQNVFCVYGDVTGFRLVKLSNSGSALWNSSAFGTSNMTGSYSDLCLNSLNDAFVMYNNTTNNCSNTLYSITVKKINGLNGSQVWTRTTNATFQVSPCGSGNPAAAIIAGPNDNIYVLNTGLSTILNSGSTIQIGGIQGSALVISNSGVISAISGSGGCDDFINPVITLDGSNIYFGCHSLLSGSTYNYTLVNQNTTSSSNDGLFLFNGNNFIGDINVDFDPSGNLYVAVSPGVNSIVQFPQLLTNTINPTLSTIPGNSGIQIIKFAP